MKISILGCGLGFSLASIFGFHGHKVVGVDINPEAFKDPRLDDGMKWFINQNRQRIEGNVQFTTDYEKVADSELIFIFVGTPLVENRLSTQHVESAIASSLKHNTTARFALLSTLPIGGCDKIFGKYPELKDKLNYIPPMVKHWRFLESFRSPPSGWQMISDNADYSKILQVYKPIMYPTVEYIFTDYRIVEVAKLVTNAFLANRIIFANAVDDWCNYLHIDGVKVMEIVGQDPRIGNQYITPGGPASGPCLPRDIQELLLASEGTSFSDLLQTLKKLNDERAEL